MGDTNRKVRITNYMVLLDLCLAIASAIIDEISMDWITRETVSISSGFSSSTKVCFEIESLMTSSFSLISLTGVRVREVSPFPGVLLSNSGVAGTLEHLIPEGPGCPFVGLLHLEQVWPFGATVATETFEGVTGAVTVVRETTEAGVERENNSAEAAASALAAWWRAARTRFFSFSAGPRWRGQRGGAGVGGGGEKAGMEWGAPGCPRVQLKPTVTRPSLVERLREALPPWAQTARNSVTDATTNWEFDLEVIFTFD